MKLTTLGSERVKDPGPYLQAFSNALDTPRLPPVACPATDTRKGPDGRGQGVPARSALQQNFVQSKGSRSLISRVFAPKRSSVCLGLERAIGTVLPPIITIN